MCRSVRKSPDGRSGCCSVQTFHPLRHRPSYLPLDALPLDEKVAAMRDPDLRAQILSESPAMWARVQVLPPEEFLAKARGGERLSCVPR